MSNNISTPAPPARELMTYKEVCLMADVASRTLRRWVQAGKITPLKYSNRSIRFRRVDVLAMLEDRELSKNRWPDQDET